LESGVDIGNILIFTRQTSGSLQALAEHAGRNPAGAVAVYQAVSWIPGKYAGYAFYIPMP
jgi:hypothetical protein